VQYVIAIRDLYSKELSNLVILYLRPVLRQLRH
jgi:hypothetical protein